MRLNYREVLPDALRGMLGLERAANSGLDDPRLLDLVKIRASQINGCAYCVRLHAAEAREAGVTDERLDMVAVWREADCFGEVDGRFVRFSLVQQELAQVYMGVSEGGISLERGGQRRARRGTPSIHHRQK